MMRNAKQSIRQKPWPPFLNDADISALLIQIMQTNVNATKHWREYRITRIFILFYLHLGRIVNSKHTTPWCVGVSAHQIDIGYELKAGCTSAYWWWQQYL